MINKERLKPSKLYSNKMESEDSIEELNQLGQERSQKNPSGLGFTSQ